MGDSFLRRGTSLRKPLPVTDDWVRQCLKDGRKVKKYRERLQSLSWFMKCLKEPLSRLANRQDKTHGAFFERRFISVAMLDEESLLAICAYIDLNPVAAGIVKVPEASPHTSIKTRVEHVTSKVEPATWRPPTGAAWRVRARRQVWRNRSGSARSRIDADWILHVKGCWKDFRWEAICSWSTTPAGCSATERRPFRPSSRYLRSARQRRGERWARLEKLRRSRLLGRFFAASRERLREVATRLGVHHLANLGGCPAR